MNRISAQLKSCAEKKRPALITYITAGDPAPAETADLVCTLADAGADIVELGVPFSDPFADGPLIQAAMLRALDQGGLRERTVEQTLEIVSRVREKSAVPLLLFGYWNPFFQFGEKALCQAAKRAGADGFLVVDLPSDEATEFARATQTEDLALIPLVAPTTSASRLAQIAAGARGFLYFVSVTGTTGSGSLDIAAVSAQLDEIRRVASTPVAVGFGIRTPEQAAALGRKADAIVVGSVLVDAIAQAGSGRKRLQSAGDLIKKFRSALDA